jgi:hypothetical protein
MRSDMAKVIVEKPRRKGWAGKRPKGYRQRLRAFGSDGPPIREGVKARWQGGTKSLNEHLGPLRRYLDSQVGRPWDRIFSEICAHINRNSAVQDHVRDHIEDYVSTCVILIDGVPCNGEGNWHYGKPLHQLPWKRWYVCPRTGRLRKILPRTKQKNRQDKIVLPQIIRVSDTLQCWLISGAWFLVTLKPLLQFSTTCPERDVILNCAVAELDEPKARRQYGDAVYAVAKRRLAKRELRQYPIPVDEWRVQQR